MSAQIKEALAACEAAREQFGSVGWFSVIESALKAAQQEAEAWEPIEAWCKRNPLFDLRVFYDDDREEFVCMFADADADGDYIVTEECADLYGATHLEALIKAAAWCREELDK